MSNFADMANEKFDAARITIGTGVFLIYGFTLAEWAAITAITYSLVQTFLLLPRVIAQVKAFIEWCKRLRG